MSGYRFCRTDDAALLVHAHNRCYVPNFEDVPELTLADFRRDTRELDLWASSCMIAVEGSEPVGVLLAAKRDTESLVLRIGVRPDHQGRGHGRHLLTSLGRKLAILGPPRLRVEIPRRWARARSFFESCDYRETCRYADFVGAGTAPRAKSSDPVVAVAVEDVLACDAFDRDLARAWERAPATLVNRRDAVSGLAVASDRIEAYVLHRENPARGTREIVALGFAEVEPGATLLEILLRHCPRSPSLPLALPRVCESEVPYPLLESWGFRRTEEYVGYEVLAAAG